METTEITKSVIEMIARGEKKEKILEYLKQLGLKEEEAQEVFRVAEERFSKALDEKMRAIAREVVREAFDEYRKQWEKETKTYIDLKISDVRDELVKKVDDLENELTATRESLSTFMASTKAKLDEAFKTFESLKIKPLSKRLFGMGFLAFSILLLFLSYLYGIVPIGQSLALGISSFNALLPHLILFLVFVFAAIGLIIAAVRIWR